MPWSAIGWNARFFLAFGGIMGFIGLAIAVGFTVGGGPVWDDWILDSRGVAVVGTPYAVEATNSEVNDQPVYRIRYQFTDQRGVVHRAHSSTTEGALISHASSRQPISILYDPHSPRRVRIMGTSASFFGAYTLIPLGVGLLGALIFLPALLGALRTRAVYRSGTAVQARVFSVSATASSENDNTVMSVEYLFNGPGGPARGSWKTVSPPPVNAVLWVIFDPKDPSRNVAVPGSAYIAEVAPPPRPAGPLNLAG